MTDRNAAIAARLQAELADLKRVVDRTVYLLDKAQDQNDDDYLDGVALNLHAFYAGVERIFEEIASEIDRSLPTGAEWHRNLLLQMSAEISNARPAVIQQATRDCLDEYRGFRHVVRNVYTFNLRPSRLRELVTDLRACSEKFRRDVTAFCAFLEQLEE
jgi:hypothetical protein